MDGVVKFFNVKRGYGFIKVVSSLQKRGYSPATGKEVFVHFANIQSNEQFRKLKEGDKVTFNTKVHPKFKKEQAIDVKLSSTV